MKLKKQNQQTPLRQSLFISLIYLAFGIVWIVASDRMLMLFFKETVLLNRFQTVKGISYVVVTAVLLFILIRRGFRTLTVVQAELSKSKEMHRHTAHYMQAIIDASPLAIFDLYPDGRIKSLWNSAAEKMFGWTEDEIRGHALLLIPDEKRQEFLETRQKVLEGKSYSGIDLEQTNKAGERINISLAVAPLLDSDGKVESMMAVAEDITQRIEREQRLNRSLSERKLLLNEIHHRVKNNLQVIYSLINLQMDELEADHDKSIFESTRNRVRAIALVHEKLYHSNDMANVDFTGYIRDLTNELSKLIVPGRRDIDLRLNLDSMTVDITKAPSLGLIANELITNAFKHAFPENEGGVLEITLRDSEQGCTLTVLDNGIGLPDDLDLENPSSFGLTMVTYLVDQIGGKIDFHGDGVTMRGTAITIVCPRGTEVQR